MITIIIICSLSLLYVCEIR